MARMFWGRRLMLPQAPVVASQIKHIIASIMSKLISTLRLIAAKRATTTRTMATSTSHRAPATRRVSEWQLGSAIGLTIGARTYTDASDVNKLQSGPGTTGKELLQFASIIAVDWRGFDTVKINYVIVKGKQQQH